MDQARAMLDELMGKDRNELDTDERKIKWSDDRVCKHYLVSFCPNLLFANTKSDLGGCDLEHDVRLKRDFEKENARVKYTYETRFLRYLEELAEDVDKKFVVVRPV